MATLISLTLNVLDMLYGQTPTERPAVDRLATAVIGSEDTLFQFDLAGSQLWEQGSYAEFFDGTGTAGEVVQLMAQHETPNADVPVLRGQRQSTTKDDTDIDTATYDETGGAAEDLWTVASAHGRSVGNMVTFSVAGTNATGYAADTPYWVVSAPSTTTLTLSNTKGGAAIAGSTDGTGWTIATPAYSAGAVFLKDPPFTHIEIQKVINEVIDSDMQNGIWYRTQRTVAYSVGRDRYPVNASDYKIERMRQRDTSSTDLGTWTFDFEGGGVDDEWTASAAHGLSVGDMVRFTAVGTGAPEYGLGVLYFVATVPTTLTAQLSATESTTVLEGTADSVGTWTAEQVVFDYREFNDGDYKLLTNQDTTATSTGKDVLIRRVVSSSDTIYYTARTRPSSSDIASLPTELANAVPYGAVSRLSGGTATRGRPASDSTISYADAAWFRQEFDRMMDQTRMRLLKELRPLPHFELGPTVSGDFRGGFRGDPFA